MGRSQPSTAFLHIGLHNFQLLLILYLDHVPWGMEAWSSKAKVFRVRCDSEMFGCKDISCSFHEAKIGVIEDPAVVVDQFGQIIVWVLPDLLIPLHQVCIISLLQSSY